MDGPLIAWRLPTDHRHDSERVAEQEVAHVILSQNVPAWHMGALVELALHMERKNFLAHRHCQSLMDLWWRGG